MQLMIDTHVLIWWWAGDERLPERLQVLLRTGGTTVFVSAVSALEIAVKVRKGQLPSMERRVAHYREAMRDDGFVQLVLQEEHALRAGTMPGDHKDPFDRALAAQSLVEELPIVTRDPAFSTFGCEVIW